MMATSAYHVPVSALNQLKGSLCPFQVYPGRGASGKGTPIGYQYPSVPELLSVYE